MRPETFLGLDEADRISGVVIGSNRAYLQQILKANIIAELIFTRNGILFSERRSGIRDKAHASTRHQTAYVVKQLTGMYVEDIGSVIGRDHSTVVYALRTINERISVDYKYKEFMEELIKYVKENLK